MIENTYSYIETIAKIIKFNADKSFNLYLLVSTEAKITTTEGNIQTFQNYFQTMVTQSINIPGRLPENSRRWFQ